MSEKVTVFSSLSISDTVEFSIAYGKAVHVSEGKPSLTTRKYLFSTKNNIIRFLNNIGAVIFYLLFIYYSINSW
jgi:hypothetical protein